MPKLLNALEAEESAFGFHHKWVGSCTQILHECLIGHAENLGDPNAGANERKEFLYVTGDNMVLSAPRIDAEAKAAGLEINDRNLVLELDVSTSDCKIAASGVPLLVEYLI